MSNMALATCHATCYAPSLWPLLCNENMWCAHGSSARRHGAGGTHKAGAGGAAAEAECSFGCSQGCTGGAHTAMGPVVCTNVHACAIVLSCTMAATHATTILQVGRAWPTIRVRLIVQCRCMLFARSWQEAVSRTWTSSPAACAAWVCRTAAHPAQSAVRQCPAVITTAAYQVRGCASNQRAGACNHRHACV